MKKIISFGFVLSKVDFQKLKEELRSNDSCIILKKLLIQLQEQEELNNSKNLNYIPFTVFFTLDNWYELAYRLHVHSDYGSKGSVKLLHQIIMSVLTRKEEVHNEPRN